MKRIYYILTLIVALLSASIDVKARGYDPDSEWSSEYSNSAIFYISLVGSDGQSVAGNYANEGYLVGAYLNGELRGSGTVSLNTGIIQVRVWGDASESGLVQFRAQVGNIEYELGSVDVNFGNDPTFGTPSQPYQLTFIPVTGVTAEDVEVTVGQTANIIWDFLPENHSTVLTPMEMYFNSNFNIFSFNPEVPSVTGISQGRGDVFMTVGPEGSNSPFSTTFYVTVLIEEINVESISAGESGTDITLWVGDFYSPDYNIQPENATNKNVTLAVADPTILNLFMGNGRGYVQAIKAGTTTLTVTTEDGGLTLVYNITVLQAPTSIRLKDEYLDENGRLTIVRDTKFEFTADMFEVTPADAYFDITTLKFISYNETIGEALAGLWVIDGHTIIGFTPYNRYQLEYKYNAITYELSGSVFVNVQDLISFNTGWNWVGIPYKLSVADINDGTKGNLTEARSKSAFVYNDVSFGLFGDLFEFEPSNGYKVKFGQAANLITDITNDDTNDFPNTEYSVTTKKGWNWIGNALPRAIALEDLMGEVFDGDIVKTLDGIAEYTDGEGWSQNLVIGEHEGFLYKATDNNLQITMDPIFCLDSEEYTSAIINGTSGSHGVKAQGFWHYDVGAYPNNMGIIAVNDVLADDSRYTIGAFVGDECRGQGTLQKGKWFIVAHGQGGEQVSLRVYDRLTGKMYDLDIEGSESIIFTEMAGSAKAPLQLGMPEVDGIAGLRSSASTSGTVFNLAGQRLDTLQKGINIVDGKKVLVR